MHKQAKGTDPRDTWADVLRDYDIRSVFAELTQEKDYGRSARKRGAE